jgi:ribosomal-protein-alanine N-acetyltransferase
MSGIPNLGPMDIQPFAATQLDTLYKIDQECFPPGISYSRKELARFIQHKLSKTWVAFSSDQIIGFVVLGREPQKVGHIVTIDVVQSARGTGVGSALMKTAEDWAFRQGLHLIYLETAEDNRPAQCFYMARGYAKVEEIPNYYSAGQTAWVMVKYL